MKALGSLLVGVAFGVVLFYGATADAQQLVYCKKIGEPRGPVMVFDGPLCPPGWVRV